MGILTRSRLVKKQHSRFNASKCCPRKAFLPYPWLIVTPEGKMKAQRDRGSISYWKSQVSPTRLALEKNRLSLCAIREQAELHHQKATFAFASVHGWIGADNHEPFNRASLPEFSLR